MNRWKFPGVADLVESLNGWLEAEDQKEAMQRQVQRQQEEAERTFKLLEEQMKAEARERARLKREKMIELEQKRVEREQLKATISKKRQEKEKMKLEVKLPSVKQEGFSKCHPSRETLEFVYRTLPPLNEKQSARKVTTMISEHLRKMKYGLPMDRQIITPFSEQSAPVSRVETARKYYFLDDKKV